MTLDWTGCAGYRDLGGTPTADGRTIRAGAALYLRSHGVEQHKLTAVRERLLD